MTTSARMLAAAGAVFTGAPAIAGYTVVQGTSAPAYAAGINFDEVGAPTGVGLSPDSWTAWGVTELLAGDGNQVVGDFSTAPGQSWLGTGNSFYGNFGVFMKLDTDVDAMSLQAWDPSGPPSPFGGGMAVVIFDDGVEVASAFVEPAWGGIGQEWFNITADGGMVFDEIRVLGFGFGPTTYVDNITWNAVPAPASASLLGLCALAARRRRF